MERGKGRPWIRVVGGPVGLTVCRLVVVLVSGVIWQSGVGCGCVGMGDGHVGHSRGGLGSKGEYVSLGPVGNGWQLRSWVTVAGESWVRGGVERSPAGHVLHKLDRWPRSPHLTHE